MKFESYLALRYFKGTRKGARFLSFIKTMSITGVAIGSAGLLIALSIVHGFKSTINDKVLGFAPHILVTTYTDEPIFRADTVMTFLDQYPEISSKQIIAQGQVMIQTKDGVSGTELKGIDPNQDVSNVASYLSEGSYQLLETDRGFPGIILGAKLAKQIGATTGSIITVYTISGEISAINSPEIKQFELTGIFQTGIDFFDELYAVVDIKHTKDLFQLSAKEGHGIEIKLNDTDQIVAFDEQLDNDLPFPYYKEPIQARFGNIFAWIELQENMIPLVISVMIIVAAFNLIGAILMMVLERTKDIGILKTIGSTSTAIRRVFLLEGLMVAVIGLTIGIALSLLFAWLQIEYQLIPLSEENYYMSYAPVEPHLFDFVIVTVVTLGLCALASWLPAQIAAKTDPLKVISYGR
jgi:lipoprotein-releasing system permease protein